MSSAAGHKFFGPELDLVLKRLRAGRHTALMGEPSTGKTHVALAVLKELLSVEDPQPGKDFELVVGLPTMTSDELIGGWTKDQETGNLKWFWGPLSRAMMNGIPLFVNEFTRLTRKCQNTFVAPLSEGYLPCPYLPGDERYVKAVPGFVAILDMNTSEHDISVEDLVWALGTRVRKIEFNHPTAGVVRKILADRAVRNELREPMCEIYEQVRALHAQSQVPHPVTVRGLLQMAEDFEIEYDGGKGARPSESLLRAATVTILPDIAGRSKDRRDTVMSLIEGVSNKLGSIFASKDEATRERERVYAFFENSKWKIPTLGRSSVDSILGSTASVDVSDVIRLTKTDIDKVPRLGDVKKAAVNSLVASFNKRGELVNEFGKFLFGQDFQASGECTHLYMKSLSECPKCKDLAPVRELRETSPLLWKKLVERDQVL